MINIQGLKAKISEKGVVKGTANNKIVYEKLENIEELIDDINNEVVEGTAVDKLNYLDDTKDQIKEALVDDGVTIEDTDTFRNYAEKVNSLKALDIGGKNPVLVKEYHEEIPFSETNFPNITPSTNFQRIYFGKEIFRQEVDFDKYDYVVKHITQVKPVYKEEIPSTSSYIIKTIYSALFNFYKITTEVDDYTIVESPSAYIRNLARYHRANYSNIQYGNSSGIQFANPSTGIPGGNKTIKVNTNDINISIQANLMTADAWQKIDAENSTITFDIKLYQVDKGTTPASVLRQDMVDYVLGG